MKKGWLLISLLAIASLFLAACAAVSSSGVIKVGALGELTGSDAAVGASFKNAAETGGQKNQRYRRAGNGGQEI